MAYAVAGRGDDDSAKRAIGEIVIDAQSCPLMFEGTGGHDLDRHEQIMQSASAGKPCIIGRIQHASARHTQNVFRVIEAQELDEFFRTNTSPFRKQALKMKRTDMDFRCNIFQ
jgi:hypothetical protein